ncbi:MAG: HD domain-containing phosphohydrolase [bacterium]
MKKCVKKVSKAAGSLDMSRRKVSTIEDHLRPVQSDLDQSELEELQTLTTKLLDVGVAISSEINLYALLVRIIEEAKGLLHAEKGTLYLVDPDKNELYFHVVDVDMLKEVRIPINHKSIAGYVALKSEPLNLEDAHKIEKTCPYKFNKEIDKKTGYRTQSVLTVPMINNHGETTGAVQLINKMKTGKVITFSDRDQKILISLASQAAVAIDNAQLYKEVGDLLNAFVRYSSSAIDERDPATAGHSRRVAMYAVTTARVMNCFSEDQLKELEFAAWLHDVGKIGVREHILTKENRLYPEEMAKIHERFRCIKLAAEVLCLKQQAGLSQKGCVAQKNKILECFDNSKSEIDADLALIERVNKAGFVPPEDQARIDEIARKTYADADGNVNCYLNEKEASALKITRGNLTDRERVAMNAHVDSTLNILSKIPFTRRLSQVPDIASCHHEKLDGSGYPKRLKAAAIPLQAKILALVDIYDALTAQDRPYKPAIPVGRSLKILQEEVEAGRLDKTVFNAFVDNEVYTLEDPGPDGTQDSRRILVP